MLSVSQILEIVRLGESTHVELKEVRIKNNEIAAPHRDDISDEIAAFANSSGGTIVFGVSDKFQEIIGINPDDVTYLVDYITEICHDSIRPLIVSISIDSLMLPIADGDSKCVTYVQIGRSLWLHKSSNGYFYRFGNRKSEMGQDQLLRIAQTRSQARIIPFDAQAVPDTTKDTLSPDLYNRFVRESSIEALAKRRLLVKSGDDNSASVAGVLMCTRNPEEFIYNSFVQAVYYRSKSRDANYQINALDCRGPLDQQILQAYKFVKQHYWVSAKKETWRQERPQYSMRSIFEAIVNAVVHRDYSLYGSKIRLFMYSDRIEIYSPGRLANTLTVDNLIENQVTRNEMLARLLSELAVEDDLTPTINRSHFLERRGEGVRIIFSESERLSSKKPVYEMFGEELKLMIFAAPSLQEM